MSQRPQSCPPGWYAILQGEEFDLEDWCHSLNEPFEPVAFKLPSGETVLRSSEFDDAETAAEVRERALILIGRFNGAINLWNDAQPVKLGGVCKIDEEGRQHSTVFMEALSLNVGRFRLSATVTQIGPDGKPVPLPPPRPSKPQEWNRLAEANDNISDLLEHAGRADNWYDIYKTLELADLVMGKNRRFEKMFTKDEADIDLLKSSANFYRHARAYRPPNLLSLTEARPILSYAVKKVLDTLSANASNAALGSTTALNRPC